MTALSIPWFLLVLLLTFIFLLFKKKWITSVIILGIIVVLNYWAECIPFRLHSICDKCDNCLKLMTFNINGASDDINKRVVGIVDLIKCIDPDVVFLAEYGENSNHLLDSMLTNFYPYTTLTKYGAQYFFSKYPLESQRQLLGLKGEDTGTYITKVNIGDNSLCLFGCHFASNNYTNDKRYMTPDSIKGRNDIIVYLRNIQRAYERRSYEADILAEEMKRIKEPIIIMGDFNDVCGSDCIKKIEALGFSDSWWEKGVGYGATIHRPLPYRIDHILHKQDIKLNNIQVIDTKGLSDHSAVYAEFKYK